MEKVPIRTSPPLALPDGVWMGFGRRLAAIGLPGCSRAAPQAAIRLPGCSRAALRGVREILSVVFRAARRGMTDNRCHLYFSTTDKRCLSFGEAGITDNTFSLSFPAHQNHRQQVPDADRARRDGHQVAPAANQADDLLSLFFKSRSPRDTPMIRTRKTPTTGPQQQEPVPFRSQSRIITDNRRPRAAGHRHESLAPAIPSRKYSHEGSHSPY